MKVGIYIETLKEKAQSGIGRHVKGLVESIAKADSDNQYYLYYTTPVLGPVVTPNVATRANIHLRPVRFANSWLADRPRLWWDYYLPWILTLDGIDLFHGPNHFVPTRGKFAKVITIHDLAYFYMTVHGTGMDRVLKEWTLKCIKSADHVIAVSESTKRDCLNEGVPSTQIQTIYQGYESKSEQDFSERQKEQAKAPLNLPAKYLLFVGTLQPRKNLSLLLDAFAELTHQLPHKLILAGAKEDCYEQLRSQAETLGISDKVIFTGYVTDIERTVLYENAELFVYPSKYEGFGLVLLEAMSFELPVVTMNVSSLPEAGGQAALYAEPENSQSLHDALYLALTCKDTREKLIAAGKHQADSFNWPQAARAHIKRYEDIYLNYRAAHK